MNMKRSLSLRWGSSTPNKLWIFLLWLISFSILNPSVSPQTDFISIDCGGEGTAPYTDPTTGILWQPDGAFMTVGSTATIQDPTLLGLGSKIKSLASLRYFPDMTINKFCYELGPVTVGGIYLVRASFLHGNYNEKNELNTSFDLLLEGDIWYSIKVRNMSQRIQKEVYMAAQRSNVSICVARSSDSYSPFISSLEVRPLSPEMYATESFKTSNFLMFLTRRYNLGALTDTDIRFPTDAYDRIWYADTDDPKVSTETLIPPPYLDAPPSLVMQTTYDISEYSSSEFTLNQMASGTYYLHLFFAELNSSVRQGDRVFNISLYGNLWTNESLDIFSEVGSFKTYGLYSANVQITEPSLVMTFNATDSSVLGPICNAYELLRFSDAPANITTSSDDVEALSEVKMSLSLSNWTGDPCLPHEYSYPWINCSFKSIPQVTSLILPDRNLQGNLPLNINLLQKLTEINFQNNSFTGNIPNWAALTNLVKLNLQHNHLSGTIPEFLGDLSNLVELSLQFNNFSGGIPANIKKRVSSSQLRLYTDGNPNLCGDSCTTPTPNYSPSSKNTAKNTVALAAGIPGAAIFLGILIFIVYRFVCKSSPKRPAQHSSGNLDEREPMERKVMLVSYEDIRSATQNFNNVIGQGGFGQVFYGTWNQTPVAIKVLSENSTQGRREFLNEVEILSTVHHRNLVTLVGYCQSPELVLVYEYLSGGSLRDYLNESSLSSLPWRTRLHIVLDAAQALEYLHASCEPKIIHGDVKSNNILLDEKMQGKFGDFGLSRIHKDEMNDVATFNLRGTRGYLDPVYSSEMTLNEKSDVYSFGVVLLEVITGRAPFNASYPEAEKSLAQWAPIHIKEGIDIQSMMDERIRKDDYNVSAVWKVMDIALACVRYERQERPDMEMVVQYLKVAVSIEERCEMEINNVDMSLVGDSKLHEVRAR